MSTQIKQLNDLTAILKQFDPERLVQEVSSLGLAWTESNAAANALEETRKTLLAKLLKAHMSTGLKSGAPGERPRAISVAAAEQNALADEIYEDHLERMVAARQVADAARVRYDMGKMRIELMRSQLATIRQEMRFAN